MFSIIGRLSPVTEHSTGASKLYRRNLPFLIKARPLVEGEVVYDGQGKVIRYQPGDMLIELDTDRYKLDRVLFDQLYTEIDNARTEHEDVSQTEPSSLGER